MTPPTGLLPSGLLPSGLLPSGLLTEFAIGLLTPFLTAAGIPDIDLARRTAAESIATQLAANPGGQAITAAQTIAFALTSIDALRLSLPDNVSLSMKLKLRGNANALSRTSQHAAAKSESPKLESTSHTEPAPEPDPTEPLAALAEPSEPEPTQADRDSDLNWAQAMKEVASEFTAELPQLQPAQRRTQLSRIGALSAIARTLVRPDAPALKSRLLASTSLLTPSPLPPKATGCTPMALSTYR